MRHPATDEMEGWPCTKQGSAIELATRYWTCTHKSGSITAVAAFMNIRIPTRFPGVVEAHLASNVAQGH